MMMIISTVASSAGALKCVIAFFFFFLIGGPADLAGLQQLDTLLQLNGQPVEQWKCVDLAHAIR